MPPWNHSIAEILIPESQIQSRIRELAGEIESDYRSQDLILVALLTGTVLFLADLIRQFHLQVRLDFMGVSSYRNDTRPSEMVLTKLLETDLNGKDVLVVDDILDTGNTLTMVLERLGQLNPASLKVCVLLDKPQRRTKPVQADYVGFEIPDYFVVGYGMDYQERFRNLPFIGILDPSNDPMP